MKFTLRVLVFVLAAICGLASLQILASPAQVKKNKILLADMQGVVRAIKDFEKKAGRLPSKEELSRLEDVTPRAYSLRYGFHFGAPPSQPGWSYPDGPKDGGWMIWYWRGEWSEFYSSWDDHFSLEDQTSIWKFCAPVVWAPPAAVLFFSLGFFRVFKKEPNQTPEPTAPSGRGSS